jgi:serine/threonine protein kinase
MTVLYQISNSKLPPNVPEFLSNELKDFLSCCLRMEPTERFNVYQLLRHPFITGDIIVNKQDLSNNISYDLNRFNSKGLMYGNNNINLNNFNSKGSSGSESYNKNMNSEFGMK